MHGHMQTLGLCVYSRLLSAVSDGKIALYGLGEVVVASGLLLVASNQLLSPPIFLLLCYLFSSHFISKVFL